MSRIGIIAAAALMLSGWSVWAEEYGKSYPVVVELYTSQGCSSCPPADALLEKLTQKSDVIPLALHVDYWDYIGWKDTFGSPTHTKRQKSYAARAGARSIYTPQMIVGGVDHVIGFKPMELMEAVQQRKATQTPVNLTIAMGGSSLEVTAASDRRLQGGADIVMLRYQPKQVVDIERGENAGRKISYVNIVTSIQVLAQWDGGSEFKRSFRLAGGEPVVILVQERNYGPILAAARYASR